MSKGGPMRLPTPQEDLHDFFTYTWGTTHEGWVYLPTATGPHGSQRWTGHYFKWPQHRDRVVNHVIEKAGLGYDVFFSPALFKQAKGVRDNVIGAYVLWVDFDGNAPEHGEWPYENVPAPTLRVQSSIAGHAHMYWRMPTFLADPDLLEDRNRSLSYALGTDASGWDANQILRPPHTTNHKRERPVTIEVWDR